MDGWIKLHRRILDWEWWSDPVMVLVWLQLMFDANYEPKRWKGIVIGRGQLVFGRLKYAEKCGISEQQMRTVMERLKSTGEITIQSTNRYSVVTLAKYELYQIDEAESTSKSTSQPTNKQPTNNQQATTPKERKKERSKEEESTIVDSKKTAVRFLRPSLEEVSAYCRERKNNIDPQQFVDHYESKGWKIGNSPMRDWKAAIRTWEGRERNDGIVRGINQGSAGRNQEHAFDPSVYLYTGPVPDEPEDVDF